ncbi:MAG TPA: Gfo/Idh/MocA family oxidoreductase [Myxococcota bacterium]|nr:Gfo/Idh/MocA family oxidoreductase [Myxococcota bacterium]
MGAAKRATARRRTGGGAEERAKRTRYAVIGAGHIVQVAVLPAFRHARQNSELAAIVSGDAAKRAELGRRYRVPTADYRELESLAQRERIDAVYIGLPNDQHCEFTERAARAGLHVLCEKPMAVTVEEGRRMLEATERAGVLLMIGYRLHFEEATLAAVELGASGRLGDLRYFDSSFSMQVRDENIRVEAEKGGGPLHDIGIYCIQAARMLLRSEPTRVTAVRVRGREARFAEVDEAVSAVMEFPGDRLAAFTCSFGAASVSSYRLVGSDGDVRVEPAYEYTEPLVHHVTLKGRTRTRKFRWRDQFAPELLHFSRCIQAGDEPEPSGREGLVDLQIIEAIQRAAESGRAVELPPLVGDRPPEPRQGRALPPVRKPKLVKVRNASRE